MFVSLTSLPARVSAAFKPSRSWFKSQGQRRRAAPPILIYQFGKVGSSSLERSLIQCWPGIVARTHNLKRLSNERPEVIATAEILRQKSEPIYIITTVRDPIARNISAFFQNFEQETGIHEKQSHTVPLDHLIDTFLTKHPQQVPLTWFDDHFKVATGIDVYEQPFPALGVQVISCGQIQVLLMQSEIPDWLKEQAVERFLGLETFKITRVNISDRKRHAHTYRAFLHAFNAPKWYLEKMYDSRYFDHFYSNQKQSLTALWSRQSSTNPVAAAAAPCLTSM